MGNILICSRVENTAHVPSTIVEADCGHKVWVGNAGMELVERGAETICVQCAADNPEVQELLAKDGPRITRAQRTEVEGVLGVAATDQSFAAFRFKMLDLDEEEDDGV